MTIETVYGYIYKITNTINNKIYVGKHKFGKDKLDESYWGGGVKLNRAYKKYGKDKFVREVIQFCYSKQELSDREIFWIKELHATDCHNGYNISRGGDGGSLPGKRNWTEQGLNNIRKANSHPHTIEHNKKIQENTSKALKGKPHNKQWHEKIIKSRRDHGTLFGVSGSHSQDAWNRGLNTDDPRVLKYIENRRITVLKEETYKGENNPFFGKHHTVESNEKIDRLTLENLLIIKERKQ